jgi:hypothetical protein
MSGSHVSRNFAVAKPPGTWTRQLVIKTCPAATITGLTPGTNYAIQVRSFADASRFSDWSDSITRICT